MHWDQHIHARVYDANARTMPVDLAYLINIVHKAPLKGAELMNYLFGNIV